MSICNKRSRKSGFAHHFVIPLLIIIGVGVIGVVTLRLGNAAVNTRSYDAAKNYYNVPIPNVSDEMNSKSSLSSKWYASEKDVTAALKGRVAVYNPSGIGYEVNDGILAITARRHCTSNGDTKLSLSNITTAQCGPGKTTRYSTGRLESKHLVTGTYLIDIRAKMPSSPKFSTRAALWMVNVPKGSPAYCDKNYPETRLSEFDILEWYSKDKNVPTSSTHILCKYNPSIGAQFYSSTDKQHYGSDWYQKWHTFSVVYNTKSTRYYIDGKLTHKVSNTDKKANDTAKKWNNNLKVPPSEAQWSQATKDMSWRIILNQDIFSATKKDKNFEPQTLYIDYVRVYRHEYSKDK